MIFDPKLPSRAFLFLMASMGFALGILVEYNWPKSDVGVFRGRLETRCDKCGSADIKYRYCTDPCKTTYILTNPAYGKKGGPVVWGYEHLHRACQRCGYDADAMECLKASETPAKAE